MKTVYKGILALLFVVIESALITIALDVGGTNVGTAPFLLYANIIGATSMIVIMYFQDKCREFVNTLKNRKMLAILFANGILIAVVAESLLVVGTISTTPSISGIIYRVYPLLIAILTPIMFKQKVSIRQYISLLFVFIGVYIVLSEGTLLSVNVTEIPAILLILGSALATAVSTLLVKKYNIAGSIFMAFSAIAAVIFFLPFTLLSHSALPINLSFSTLLSIIFVGAIEFGIAGIPFYYSYKLFNPGFVGAALLTTPFITVILSFVILGTPMYNYYFLAATAIAIGIFVQHKEFLNAPELLKTGDTLKHTQIFDVTSAFIDNKSPIVSRHISGGNRALAIELDMKKAKNFIEKEIELGECLFFIHTRPHRDIRIEEIDFLKEILELKAEHVALVGMGNPETVERVLSGF